MIIRPFQADVAAAAIKMMTNSQGEVKRQGIAGEDVVSRVDVAVDSVHVLAIRDE